MFTICVNLAKAIIFSLSHVPFKQIGSKNNIYHIYWLLYIFNELIPVEIGISVEIPVNLLCNKHSKI